MKLFSIFLFLMFALSCSKEENVKLQKESPTYVLTQKLASTLPYVDPDKNNVIVRTNHFKITTGDLMQYLHLNLGKRLEQLAAFDSSRLRQTIAQSARDLAEKKLLLLEAEKAGTRLSAGAVDSVLSAQYTRAGGEDKYLEMLKGNDISAENIKLEITNGLTIRKYLEQRLADEAQVTEDELQQAYREDKTASVRHILLNTQGKSDSAKEEIRTKMETILAKARQGEDFAELAKKYTEDPGSKSNGGLYENFGRGRMVKAFEEASFSVPVGEISDIVETNYGFHIIKVVDRKQETQPFDEVREQLEAQIKSKKFTEAYQSYLEMLQKDADYQMSEF
ncbi:MAG: peptidylprolyl isomerase [bacterium]